MSALSLGLIAALCWGLHDILVRQVSQTVPLLAALMVVLVAGTGLQLAMLVSDVPVLPSPDAAVMAALSGTFFLMASLGLYFSFQRGPVRLVAPLIASYPILSVGWAAVGGAPVTPLQWLAVACIIAGVSLVAALSGEDTDAIPPKGPTITYALAASVGFAATFALGQRAADMWDHLPATFLARLAAIALLAMIIRARGLRLWPPRRAFPVLIGMGCLDGVAHLSVLSAGGLPDAQYAAVAASTFGLLTIVMAWAFLREAMTPAQWLGCVVAFCGIGYLAI